MSTVSTVKPKINIYNAEGVSVGERELDPSVFNVPIKENVVHEVATSLLSNARLGLAHTKTKGEVRGGGKKPWKQKGTGRARHGSSRSPIWKGGGVVFGPRNDRNYKRKINKKTGRSAVCMCLSDRLAANQLILLDQYSFPAPKTKHFNDLLKKISFKIFNINLSKIKSKTTFLILGHHQEKDLSRLVRNLPGVSFVFADNVNAIDVLSNKYLVMDVHGLELLEKTFKNRRIGVKKN